MAANTPPNDRINVAWTDVVRFLRQLSHDLRNQLNAVELQSAFLAEIATDPEIKEEIARLRKMVSECGISLQKLSVRLNPPAPTLITYSASDFVEDLRIRVRNEFSTRADAISWKIDADGWQLSIDPQLLQEALLELVRNAFEHQTPGSSLRFNAGTEGDNLVLTLDEPKAQFEVPTDNWGREPLRYVNRGHFGLGLNRARTIIENQGGLLKGQYDSTEGKLITTITIPLAKPRG
jgi:K+-sensing histidine kinase KdpD